MSPNARSRIRKLRKILESPTPPRPARTAAFSIKGVYWGGISTTGRQNKRGTEAALLLTSNPSDNEGGQLDHKVSQRAVLLLKRFNHRLHAVFLAHNLRVAFDRFLLGRIIHLLSSAPRNCTMPGRVPP